MAIGFWLKGDGEGKGKGGLVLMQSNKVRSKAKMYNNQVFFIHIG